MKQTPLLTLTHTQIHFVTHAHGLNRTMAGRTEDICPLQMEMPLDKHAHTRTHTYRNAHPWESLHHGSMDFGTTTLDITDNVCSRVLSQLISGLQPTLTSLYHC